MSLSEVQKLIKEETDRQSFQVSLIPSENYVSKAVAEALSSSFTNKYAEGYPGKRYYAGNKVADKIEELAKTQAQKLFATDYHVNVQPYSGSPANLAAYTAVLKPGDKVLAMSLSHGGHLTHGHHVSLTGSLYAFVHYGVSQETELIDYEAVLALAKEHRPKLIVCGATAYPAFFDFSAFSKIAKEVGALLMVDMAHTAGLIAGAVHPSPFGLADIITSSTHKTLRGPRGGIIFCKPELAKAVDRAVFPGLQGGPHMHVIAAQAVAFTEALQPSFKVYAKQMAANAKALAYRLQQHGLRLIGDGTDTHLMLVDITAFGIRGQQAQDMLEKAGIIANKNAIPFDPHPPMDPSGLRLGTPAVTSRGMKEKEMDLLADCIASVLTNPESLGRVAMEVQTLAKKFRIPAFY